MTERVRIAEALRNGIQRDSRLGVNTPYLEALKGLRATEWGLRDFNVVNTPITPPAATSWPFPQLFRGKKHTHLMDAQAVYAVTESTWGTSAMGLESILVRDANALLAGGGGHWHCADFHDFQIWCNGVEMVVAFPTSDVYWLISVRPAQTCCNHKDGRVLLGGFPNGASWWASNTRTQTWLAAYFTNAPDAIDSYLTAFNTNDFQNWVWWGSIGVGDVLGLWLLEYLIYGNATWTEQLVNGAFTGSATGWTVSAGWSWTPNKVTHIAGSTGTLRQTVVSNGAYYYYSVTVTGRTAGTLTVSNGTGLSQAISSNTTLTGYFFADAVADTTFLLTADSAFDGAVDTAKLIRLAADIGFSPTNPWFQTLAKRNESGMMPLPVRGQVLKMIPLGDAVVCYTTDGICAMVAFSNPVATYGTREIENLTRIGVAGRGAAGGGEHGHLFIDSGGTLWFISKDLTAERIGYQHIFVDYLDYGPTIEYDEQHQEWYISADAAAGYLCYVFTRNGGLSQSPVVPTSVTFAEGGIVAAVVEDASGDPDVVELTTGRIRAGDGREESSLNYIILVTQDTDAAGWTCYVDYRTEQGVAWTPSELLTPDTRGHIRCSVSGIEFRIRLLHPDRTKCDLDEIILEFNDGDRHSVGRLLP